MLIWIWYLKNFENIQYTFSWAREYFKIKYKQTSPSFEHCSVPCINLPSEWKLKWPHEHETSSPPVAWNGGSKSCVLCTEAVNSSNDLRNNNLHTASNLSHFHLCVTKCIVSSLWLSFQTQAQNHTDTATAQKHKLLHENSHLTIFFVKNVST